LVRIVFFQTSKMGVERPQVCVSGLPPCDRKNRKDGARSFRSSCSRRGVCGFGIASNFAGAAGQAVGADSCPEAARVQASPAGAHRAEKRHRLFLQEDHELPFVYGSVLIRAASGTRMRPKRGWWRFMGRRGRTSGTAKLSGDALDDLLGSQGRAH